MANIFNLCRHQHRHQLKSKRRALNKRERKTENRGKNIRQLCHDAGEVSFCAVFIQWHKSEKKLPYIICCETEQNKVFGVWGIKKEKLFKVLPFEILSLLQFVKYLHQGQASGDVKFCCVLSEAWSLSFNRFDMGPQANAREFSYTHDWKVIEWSVEVNVLFTNL